MPRNDPEDFDDDLDPEDDDDLDPEDDTKPEPQQVRMSRKDIRRLEKKAKEGDKHAARVAELEKKLAFKDAKVDLDSKSGAFFAKHYDGELDPEKIREAAQELGVPVGEVEPEGPPLDPDEEKSTKERQEASTGAQPDDGKGEAKPDPKEQALKVGQERIDAGKSEEDGLAAGIGALAGAAMDGDKRATWTIGE